jgi:hypothetical protein
MSESHSCPICDGDLRPADVPRDDIYFCPVCSEIVQRLPNDTFVPMGDFFNKNALGDDRTRAAVSRPRITTVKSFIDSYESTMGRTHFDLAALAGTLRTLLAMLENRLDIVTSITAGLALGGDPEATKLHDAACTARELVSTLPPTQRGIPKEKADERTGEAT